VIDSVVPQTQRRSNLEKKPGELNLHDPNTSRNDFDETS